MYKKCFYLVFYQWTDPLGGSDGVVAGVYKLESNEYVELPPMKEIQVSIRHIIDPVEPEYVRPMDIVITGITAVSEREWVNFDPIDVEEEEEVNIDMNNNNKESPSGCCVM